MKNRKGMTLIEVLIVISLMSLLGLALYQGMTNGIRLWKRAQEHVKEEDIAIFFDKLSFDFTNAFFFSRIPYEGSRHAISFPALVEVGPEGDPGVLAEGSYEQIGKVSYVFDEADRTVYRKVGNYSQALKNQYAAPVAVVNGVQDVRFHYVYLTDMGENIGEEMLEVFPSSIEVDVTFTDDKGRRTMRKVINVPISM